jgi:hypothetical protein
MAKRLFTIGTEEVATDDLTTTETLVVAAFEVGGKFERLIEQFRNKNATRTITVKTYISCLDDPNAWNTNPEDWTELDSQTIASESSYYYSKDVDFQFFCITALASNNDVGVGDFVRTVKGRQETA